MPVEVGVGYVSIVPSVRGLGTALQRQLVAPASDAGDDAGEQAGSRFSARLGSGIKKGALAAGAIGGALLAKGFVGAVAKEQASSKLAAQLNLSKAESARLGKLSGSIYAKGYGESAEQVNDSLKALAQNGVASIKAPRRELAGLSRSALSLSEAFGVDVTDSAKAAGQVIKTGLAANGREAFDIITRGFQSGADKSGDLLDTLNEYSTQFRDLGLTGKQSIGLLTQGLKAGARDSDIVADALKEFAIRAKDGSATTAQGFKAIGLSADTMAATFAKGGPKASKALDTVLDRIRAIKDPAKRSQVAIALFGTQAEDLQQSLFALDPSTAAAGLGKVGGAADAMGKKLRDNAGAEIERFKRTAQANLTNFVGNSLLPALEKIAPAVGTALGPVKALFGWIVGDPGRMQAATVAVVGLGTAIAALKVAGAVRSGVTALWGGLQSAGAMARTAGTNLRFAAFAARYYATIGAQSAKQAILTGAAWARSAAASGAGWAAARARAVGAFVQTAAAATANAARTAVAWVAAQTRSALATARATAALVLQRGAMVAAAAGTRIMAAGQWVLNAAMRANPIGLVVGALVLLGTALVAAYKKSATFRAIVQGAMRGAMVAVKALGAAGLWLWKNALQPAFRAIGSVVGWLYRNIIRPYFTAAGTVLRAYGAVAKWLYQNAVQPALRGIGSVARWLYDKVLRPVFDKGKTAVRAFGTAFRVAKDAIANQWGKLKSITKKPVQFVVDVVYNNGIRAVWNKVSGAFGGPTLKRVEFARGGIMPGYTPGRDVHQFVSPTGGRLDLSGGESIMRPEFTRAVGPGFVGMMNRLAATRGASGVRTAMGAAAGGVQQFKSGGLFGWIGKAGSTLKGLGSSAWDAIKRGASWLKDTMAASARAGMRNLVTPLLNKIPGLDTGFGKLIKRIPSKIVDTIFGYAKKADDKLGTAGGSLANIGGSGVARWRPYVIKALRANGLSSSSAMVAKVLRQIATESGGNPRAVQGAIGDINNRTGNLARGLMQTIPPTFNAYKFPGHGNIYNGYDNLLAALNYAKHRYGKSLSFLGQGHGYAAGGTPRPGEVAWVGENGPELVSFGGGSRVYDSRSSIGGMAALTDATTHLAEEIGAARVGGIRATLPQFDAEAMRRTAATLAPASGQQPPATAGGLEHGQQLALVLQDGTQLDAYIDTRVDTGMSAVRQRSRAGVKGR